ncbi:MAG: zinc ABC transporter substrate-binding protein [Gemmatimonadota bacterium]|nr:MAG: zinc ABC transporter substrate-binding protein [Gemmatimonadota bacterium]
MDNSVKPYERRVRAISCAAVSLALIVAHVGSGLAQQKLKVVTTLPTYAAIAREITGDLAEVDAIARGDEDPHFVNPRPSFAARVGEADLFVVTGLDLELWVPAILDRARNRRVIEGAPGHVAAYSGIKLLEVPENVSRAGGDVHVFGNPHIHTDPINAIIIARNVLAHLRQVDPANAARYEQNARSFEDRVLRRLFGDRLVDILGGDVIFRLARNYQFWDFASDQSFEGRPLTEYVGGWLAQGAPFRDRRIACYHKNWAYFSARFRVECAIFIEPQPGIPPSPGHLQAVIDLMRDESIPVILAANYYSRSQVDRVAERTGARAVVVPEHVAGAEGVDDYFQLVDAWVSALADAFLALDRRREHRE